MALLFAAAASSLPGWYLTPLAVMVQEPFSESDDAADDDGPVESAAVAPVVQAAAAPRRRLRWAAPVRSVNFRFEATSAARSGAGRTQRGPASGVVSFVFPPLPLRN